MYELVNQPYEGTLEEALNRYINSNDINQIFIVVAYAKVSGVNKLINRFNSLIENHCDITVCVGIDQSNTSVEAIRMLLGCTSELYVYHMQNLTVTFHPKLYYLTSKNNGILFVGSNNLTQGGLETNDEIFTSNNEISESTLENLNRIIERYTDVSSGFCHRVDESLIEELINNGYILSEAQLRSNINNDGRSSNETSTATTRQSLFSSVNRRSTTSRSVDEEREGSSTTTTVNEQHEDSSTTTIVDEQHELLDMGHEIQNYNDLYVGGYDEFINRIHRTTGYYHIPQGVHLGHIFYIIKSIGDNIYPLDNRLNLFQHRTTGPNGEMVRQTRYKLALAMELLLIEDYRLQENPDELFNLQLTGNGWILYNILENFVDNEDEFYAFSADNPNTWDMVYSKRHYNQFVSSLPESAKSVVYQIFQNMNLFVLTEHCVRNLGTPFVSLNYFYAGNQLWSEPLIQNWINLIRTGVPYRRFNTPTQTSLEHRMPFIIDLLQIFEVIQFDSSNNNYIVL